MKALTLSLLVLLLVTCKKPKEEQHLGPIFFREFADFFWFKPGTYWIYENNRTGELDTCTLTYIERDTLTLFVEVPRFKRWYTYESINWGIKTRHRNGFVDYNTVHPCLECASTKDDTTIAVMRSGGTNVFYKPLNHYPQFFKFHNSIQIGDTIYSNIYQFDKINDNTLPTWNDSKLLWGKLNGTAQYSSYYWAKDIGLVQIKYATTLNSGPDSAYWILKDSKILKY